MLLKALHNGAARRCSTSRPPPRSSASRAVRVGGVGRKGGARPFGLPVERRVQLDCCRPRSPPLPAFQPLDKERRSASDLLPASPSPGQSLTAGEGRRRAQATRPGLSVPPSIGTHLPVGRLREGVAQPFRLRPPSRPREGEVPLNLRHTRPVVALAPLSPTSFPLGRGDAARPLCLALIHLPVGKGGTVLLGLSVSSTHTW